MTKPGSIINFADVFHIFGDRKVVKNEPTKGKPSYKKYVHLSFLKILECLFVLTNLNEILI